MILDEILAHKTVEVAERKARQSQSALADRVAAAPGPRDFRGALASQHVAVISEVKRASPSAGAMRPNADAVLLATHYEDAGAAAISVITDERYFGGSQHDLAAVRQSVGVPTLCKDFMVDPYQVYEARALGADAVLLIVRALDRSQLAQLAGLVDRLGMAALVEVHDEAELDLALDIGAVLIGINNRDLTRMTVDLATTEWLRPKVPSRVTVVAESGIRTADDVRRMARIDVDAVLIGEGLVTAENPGERLRELLAAGRAVGELAGHP